MIPAGMPELLDEVDVQYLQVRFSLGRKSVCNTHKSCLSNLVFLVTASAFTRRYERSSRKEVQARNPECTENRVATVRQHGPQYRAQLVQAVLQLALWTTN
jgi:hypothetical protein